MPRTGAGPRSVPEMGGIVSRWPVRQEQRVTTDDLGDDVVVSDEAVEHWVAAACLAYLDRCPELEEARASSGLELKCQSVDVPRGARLGRPTAVVVTAGATEIRPSSFTIAVRLRPVGGEGTDALNATCSVRLEDPTTGQAAAISNEIHDELIALAHSGRHTG